MLSSSSSVKKSVHGQTVSKERG